ncbi:metallophosphoesterase family protein [Natrinema salsiterrestre]|uniref:Metallophosphoesterase n=1 Tax=Natrinema salsiterrestre TaxID=2950540 RepID=A0A9Q4Q3P7_9EURY|nr:metallophosphoesterase [Natrinema salsiterrestre]MDF9747781.1 metallophosphoesterase [Natrinema salsiterrestre]
MRLLVFGDTHLKPSGKSLSYEQLELPPNTDCIVTVGDVVHRTTSESIAAGKEFMSSLDDLGVPVYTVPGNHDPFPDHRSMVDGLPSTEVLHDTVIELQGVDLVGWGCGQFDAEPEVKCRAFESLDPRNKSEGRRHAADRNAARLEDALYDYITDEIGENGVAHELDISKTERKVLADQLAELDQVFDQLDRLLERASSPTLLLTHVPPYGRV